MSIAQGIELSAVVLALLGIILTILESRICWIANVLACLLYIKIFHNALLPGQVLLQFLYILASIYGFISWGKTESGVIRRLGTTQFLITIIFSIGLGYLIHSLKQEYLWSDSTITVASIITTYLTIKKYLENWALWLVIDMASVALFLSRDLKMTAVLYLIYAILSFVGYRQWSKSAKSVADLRAES